MPVQVPSGPRFRARAPSTPALPATPKPGVGAGAAAPHLSPHQQYAAWVAAGRHGASGHNVQTPPPPGSGSGGPPSAGGPGGTPAPGAGGPAAPGSGFVGAPPPGSSQPYGNTPYWMMPPGQGQSIPGFAPGFGQPTGQGPGQYPGQAPAPYAYNNPYSAYLAAIPGMQLQEKQAISGAMENAGFTGNRFSTTAENQAGQIGAQTGLQENQLLLQTMYNQSQQDQDRALQAATWGAPSVGGLQNNIAQSEFMVPAQLGQYEQQRGDTQSMNAYNAWNANKLGWFPYLLGAAAGGGGNAGVPGQIYSVTNPGSTNTLGQIGSLLPGIAALGGGMGNLFGGGGGGGGKMGGGGSPGAGQSGGATSDPGIGG
jgi:hypothetical protein